MNATNPVTPAQAGAHPSFCSPSIDDTTCVSQLILADGWVDPRLRGDDGVIEAIALIGSSIALGGHS